MTRSAGMRSLALAFPQQRRSNDWWREHHPDMVAQAEQKALSRVWKRPTDLTQPGAFDREMIPYLDDPFRGAVSRRFLDPGQTASSLELDAARRALAAARMAASDIDLALVCSFLPDSIGVGNAPYIARELALKGAAWNIESTCSSASVAFQSAVAFVRSGQFRNVLVVLSCTYSRVTDDDDTISWANGDGAAAFIVSTEEAGYGFLGAETLHTAQTCGAVRYVLRNRPGSETPVIRMETDEIAGRALKEASEHFLKACTEGALRAAGVSLGDISYFAFPTPTAWYSAFCCRALEIDSDKTINTHLEYCNTGPVLMPTTLHRGAQQNKIRRGDLVLMYTIGSTSSASASVVRWGDVALAGP